MKFKILVQHWVTLDKDEFKEVSDLSEYVEKYQRMHPWCEVVKAKIIKKNARMQHVWIEQAKGNFKCKFCGITGNKVGQCLGISRTSKYQGNEFLRCDDAERIMKERNNV